MKTDRRPSRGAPRQEYDDSDRLTEIGVPPSEDLARMFRLLETARDSEERGALDQVCRELLESLAAFYRIAPPTVKLLGVRPHSTSEGLLASELFGDYNFQLTRIRLWTQTAIQRQWTSSRTLLSTLCHEFMHHLDVTQLGFPSSYHTAGFFERTHRLYLGVLGQAHYPLMWHSAEKNGSRTIDWPATNRRKALAVASTSSSRAASEG
ncbi:MAG: hypothetical protein ACREL3_01160 [Gemmatimonadales bacterium]